jgi:hypothetical protein
MSAIGRLAGSGPKGLRHEEAGRCRRPASRRLFVANRGSGPGAALTNGGHGHHCSDYNDRGGHNHPASHQPGPSRWWSASIAPRCTRPGGRSRRQVPTTKTTGSRLTWMPMATASPAKRCTDKSEDQHQARRRIATPPTRMSACRHRLPTLTAPTLATGLRLTTATATHTAWTPMAMGMGATGTASEISAIVLPEQSAPGRTGLDQSG